MWQRAVHEGVMKVIKSTESGRLFPSSPFRQKYMYVYMMEAAGEGEGGGRGEGLREGVRGVRGGKTSEAAPREVN
jgi:hypothetical protein